MVHYTENPAIAHFRERFRHLYGNDAVDRGMRRLQALIGRYGVGDVPPQELAQRWSEKDSVLITYGDTVCSEGKPSLPVLKDFLDARLKKVISTIHILPFCPWSSDDGFSVIDYRQVAEDLGTWNDIGPTSSGV